MYRYYTQWLSKPQTFEIIEEAFYNVKRSKRILCPEKYNDELKNYPQFLVQDLNYKPSDKKRVTKRGSDMTAQAKIMNKNMQSN